MAVFNTNAPTDFNYQSLILEAGDAIAFIADDPSYLDGGFGSLLDPTTLTSTLASGLTTSGATWTYVGSNLQPIFLPLAGTSTIQTVTLAGPTFGDGNAELLVKGPFSLTFSTEFLIGASGSITKVEYESDSLYLNFQGSFPLTTPTTTITKLDFVDELNDLELHLTGSMTFNFSTFAVTGTVSSFSIDLEGQHIAASGMSLSANTFMTGSTLTVIETMLAGNDTITADEAGVRLSGYAGNDTYIFSEGAGPGDGPWVIEDFFGASPGIDTVKTAFDYTLDVNVENGMLLAGGTSLTGNHQINTLTGNTGDNTLDGARGKDALVGAGGNDTFIVDLQKVGTAVSLEDVVTEALNAGTDTLMVRANPLDTITFAMQEHVGEPTFTRIADANNPLVGSWTVPGAAGGGTAVLTLLSDGSFTFAQDSSEDLADGVETGTYSWNPETQEFSLTNEYDSNSTYGLSNFAFTHASISGSTLTLETESGDLTGTKVASTTNPLIGGWSMGSGDDLITVAFLNDGTYLMAQNNGLLGMEHATFTWSPANGAFQISNFTGGLGTDGLAYPNINSMTMYLGVPASSTYTVVLAANVENLDLSLAGSTNLNGTGNALNNTLTGSAGNNVLDGGLGNDTYVGSDGNDTYLFSQAGDVHSGTDNGIDTAKVSATGNPAYLNLSDKPELENVVFTGTAGVTLTGNAAANSLTGGAGSDILNGGAGNDVMAGGGGNDQYTVDSAADVVNDSAGTGDSVIANVDGYTLGTGIENLLLGDDSSIGAGAGNTLANTLTANAWAPVLAGGLGNDTYIFNASLGSAQEESGAGTDTVRTAFDYELEENIENAIVLGSTGRELGGNGLNNLLTGSTGDDILIGGGGKDSMVGGAGNDTYHGNLVKPLTTVMFEDMITDSAGTGDTLVMHAEGALTLSTPTFLITLAATLENLDLADTGTLALNVTGNASGNTLLGNAGNNKLDGGAGNDDISGAGGNDWLLGGAGNDHLDGGAGNDLLDGGLGNDTFTESAGDDTYLISEAGDNIEVGDSDGTDTAKVGALGNGTYLDLSDKAWLENVIYTGAVGKAITGNGIVNSLTGGAGADSINGGAGADVMIGMGGNDQYTVDNVGDSITDSAGVDTVVSSIDYTLGTGLEKLTLAPAAGNLNGTGNTLANTLLGNEGDNELRGGGGLDAMTGGGGNDTFVFDRAAAGNVISITDFTDGDHIAFDVGAVEGFAALFSEGVLQGNSLLSGLTTPVANADHAQLLYNTTSGALYYDANGAGGVAAVQIATIVGHPALAADDFTMIGVS